MLEILHPRSEVAIVPDEIVHPLPEVAIVPEKFDQFVSMVQNVGITYPLHPYHVAQTGSTRDTTHDPNVVLIAMNPPCLLATAIDFIFQEGTTAISGLNKVTARQNALAIEVRQQISDFIEPKQMLKSSS